MRKFTDVVFDGMIQGTDANYTDTKWDELLASADQLAIQAVFNVLSGTPNLTVQVEHSDNGRGFSNKNTTAEIDNVGVGVSPRTVCAVGGDMGRSPCQGRARLRVQLSAAGIVHVKIHVCGRGHWADDEPKQVMPGAQPGCGAPEKAEPCCEGCVDGAASSNGNGSSGCGGPKSGRAASAPGSANGGGARPHPHGAALRPQPSASVGGRTPRLAPAAGTARGAAAMGRSGHAPGFGAARTSATMQPMLMEAGAHRAARLAAAAARPPAAGFVGSVPLGSGGICPPTCVVPPLGPGEFKCDNTTARKEYCWGKEASCNAECADVFYNHSKGDHAAGEVYFDCTCACGCDREICLNRSCTPCTQDCDTAYVDSCFEPTGCDEAELDACIEYCAKPLDEKCPICYSTCDWWADSTLKFCLEHPFLGETWWECFTKYGTMKTGCYQSCEEMGCHNPLDPLFIVDLGWLSDVQHHYPMPGLMPYDACMKSKANCYDACVADSKNSTTLCDHSSCAAWHALESVYNLIKDKPNKTLLDALIVYYYFLLGEKCIKCIQKVGNDFVICEGQCNWLCE